MRFELIDRVVERSDDRIKAVKAVTSAEEYLADHFPGFPVLPGVLMLETLVQAGRLLVEPLLDGQGPMVLVQVRNVRYGNMVKPGQCLEVEVNVRKQQGSRFELQGEGKVDGQVAVQGRFSLDTLETILS